MISWRNIRCFKNSWLQLVSIVTANKSGLLLIAINLKDNLLCINYIDPYCKHKGEEINVFV